MEFTAVLRLFITHRFVEAADIELVTRFMSCLDFSHSQRWELGHPILLPTAQTWGQK